MAFFETIFHSKHNFEFYVGKIDTKRASKDGQVA
jgi:hypothetical protein